MAASPAVRACAFARSSAPSWLMILIMAGGSAMAQEPARDQGKSVEGFGEARFLTLRADPGLVELRHRRSVADRVAPWISWTALLVLLGALAVEALWRAAALGLTVSASGTVGRTTPLPSVEEMDAAGEKSVAYREPGT